MKKFKCSNYECPECMWGNCQLDNPEEECDEVFIYGEPIETTVGELIERLQKYDPAAKVEFVAKDDLGFNDYKIVPKFSRLVWDSDRNPVVEIF